MPHSLKTHSNAIIITTKVSHCSNKTLTLQKQHFVYLLAGHRPGSLLIHSSSLSETHIQHHKDATRCCESASLSWLLKAPEFGQNLSVTHQNLNSIHCFTVISNQWICLADTFADIVSFTSD